MQDSEMSTPEVPKRHKTIRANYSEKGKRGEYGLEDAKRIRAEQRAIALVESGILPQPLDNQKLRLLSPSANRGMAESILQEKLRDTYDVIAGDIADVIRYAEVPNRIQVNAALLPFRDKSITAIYDMGGAVYYEARNDRQERTRGKYVKELIEGYKKVLNTGGLLIVDDRNPTSTDGTTSSGEMINLFYGSNGLIDGFAPPQSIGENETHMRVYKKLA